MRMPNGTFAALIALIGSAATILAANGIGNPTLNGALATILTTVVGQFAHNAPKPGA